MQADIMWEVCEGGVNLYDEHRSWSELPESTNAPKPEFKSFPSPHLQACWLANAGNPTNSSFETQQCFSRPALNHSQMPPARGSPLLTSPPDLSPDLGHSYTSSLSTSPVQSSYDEIKVEAQHNSSRSSARRRDQNRAAQRAFRERREQHLKDLEGRVRETEEKYSELQVSYHELEEIHKEAKQKIERQSIELDVFRSIVKCGYRPCECGGGEKVNDCAIESELKERVKGIGTGQSEDDKR
ncbi:MAG: hypothetical protein M1820_007178 [Bogoriella megaspora]|nr:MAG: hypothetical protein M1820_007178 [Bogoriella megaspora]